MNSKIFPLLFLVTLSVSCAPATTSSKAAQIITVHASSASEPWLADLYLCAATTSAVINITPDAPDITIRIGEPHGLKMPAFQIGTDELLVVVNRSSPLQTMGADQVRDIFAGPADSLTQVWVYSAGQDIQLIFDGLIMNGRSISPFAHLAVSARQMAEAINADVNAVGLLPRRWETDDMREIFSIPSVPVLAVTPSAPTGVVAELIACLQK